MDEAAQFDAREKSDDELFAIVQGRPPAVENGLARRHALELLFARHHARVFLQCVRLLGDEALAEDATQEIFLSFLEKSQRYDDRRYFSSWLYIVVRNHCLNVRRGRKHEVQDYAMETWASRLVDPGDPHGEIQTKEMVELLEGICASELTVREREVIHLRYYWGLSVKEINAALGLQNKSGARSHLATAHRKLRSALHDHIGEDVLGQIFEEG